MLDILFQNPIVFVLLIGALIISLSIHEFAHAFAAVKLGDDTPKYFGRVTLDPRAHIDPIGLLVLVVAGFGWGKPVGFNPINLKNPKRDSALIAAAGPLSNFVLAALLALVFHLVGGGHIFVVMNVGSLAMQFLAYLIFYNLILGIFNLIPVHPLDGFKVVRGFLSGNLVWQWDQTQQLGTIILIILIFTGATSSIVNPILTVIMRFLGLL